MGDKRPRWWQLPWRDIVAVTVGAFILIEQTAFEALAQPVLVGAGVALVGVGGTEVVKSVVKRVSNGNGGK